MTSASTPYIVIGKFGAPHGVRGWVKVFSFTQPMDNILTYQPWLLDNDSKRPLTITDCKAQKSNLIVQLEGCDDRDQAARYTNQCICIPRTHLPEPGKQSYYWNDLLGLRVVNLQNIELGHVDYLLETGANDVLVLKGERARAVPFLQGQVIKHVDLTLGIIQVDWDAEF